MRLKYLILLGLVLSLTGLIAWTNSKPEQKDLIVYKSFGDYKKEWVEVDSLPKSGKDEKTQAQAH